MKNQEIKSYKYHGNSLVDFFRYSRFNMLSKLNLKRVLNILHCTFEWKNRNQIVHSKPFILRIDVSSVCNLKCPSCGLIKGRQKRQTINLMSLNDFKSIFDKLREKAWRVSFYISGEPMTNPELLDMVHYAASYNVYTHFSTNFTLLKPGMAERMISSKLDSLSVCLDGFTQENHSKYRVGGKVSQVKEAIIELGRVKRNLKSTKPYLNVYTITFNHVKKEIEKIKGFCKAHNVDKLTIRPDQLHFDGSGVEKSKTQTRPKSKCFWPWMTMTIDTSGNVYPCSFAYGIAESYGNIKKNTLDEIWNNRKYQETRRFLTRNIVMGDCSNLPCLKCKLYG